MNTIAYIPVEARHLSAVYALLADLTTDSVSDSVGAAEPTAEWDRDTIIDAARRSSERARRGLIEIAKAGDAGILTTELAEVLGYEHGGNAIAGMLGAVHRRCRNHYGIDTPLWVAEWEFVDDSESKTSSRLTMVPAIREVVLTLAE